MEHVSGGRTWKGIKKVKRLQKQKIPMAEQVPDIDCFEEST